MNTSPPHLNAGQDVEPKAADFRARYRIALADRRQQRNLLSFQQAWARDRANIFVDQDFEQLRRSLRAAKDLVIADLDQWVERFARQAEANGAIVHRVGSAMDACAQVLALCQCYGTDLIVKSKSMVSEEVELNHYLAQHGVRAVEGDLGEWLVQLAGERPSHMVLPIIHKDRHQAAALVAQATGSAVSGDDVPGIVQTARDVIRTNFRAAGIGLTGANALVAEDGSVLLVTNEGNADLTVTIPPVHVVLAGIEKVVPALADAATQVHLLARSATAQRITAYTTLIRRPPTSHALHIVLVDNGRSVLHADDRYRDALRCIRCGACADTCPPFQVVGGHVFGHIYTGAIGLVVTPAHHGLAADAGPQSLCISCNACQSVCPVDIPLPRQILDRRAEVIGRAGDAVPLRMGTWLWSHPHLFGGTVRLAALAIQPWRRRRSTLVLPQALLRLPGIARQASWRTLPLPAPRPYRDVARARMDGHVSRRVLPHLASHVHGKTVALFAQCLTDRFWPEQADAVERVLTSLGCRVTFPQAQHCCGLVALDAGDPTRAKQMARQTIRTLEGDRADYIISGAASCIAAIVHDYAHLFRDEPPWQKRAAQVAARTVTFSRFLADIAGLPARALDDGSATTVTYHDFCQSRHVLKEASQVRQILGDLLGCRLVELPEVTCCGFGGSRSALYPEVAAAIGQRKLAAIAGTGAHVLVTDNPGCIAHLRAMIEKQRMPLQVYHLAEFVADRLDKLARGAIEEGRAAVK